MAAPGPERLAVETLASDWADARVHEPLGERGAGPGGSHRPKARPAVLPLDALLDDGGPSAEAEAYLQEVGEFFLALRGTGLLLSPDDMQLVQEWQEAGFPLNKVLCGLHRGAEKRLSNDKPVRTVRALRVAVEKEVFGRALKKPGTRRRRAKGNATAVFALEASAQSLGGRTSGFRRDWDDAGLAGGGRAEPQDGLDAPTLDESSPVRDAFLAVLDDELLRLAELFEALQDFPEMLQVVETVQEALLTEQRTLLEHLRGPELILTLLGLGKRFYAQLWDVLPPSDRWEVIQEALQSQKHASAGPEALEDDGSDESPFAAELASDDAAAAHGVDEALRTLLLRARFGVLEPSRLCALWDVLALEG